MSKGVFHSIAVDFHLVLFDRFTESLLSKYVTISYLSNHSALVFWRNIHLRLATNSHDEASPDIWFGSYLLSRRFLRQRPQEWFSLSSSMFKAVHLWSLFLRIYLVGYRILSLRFPLRVSSICQYVTLLPAIKVWWQFSPF